MKIKPSTKPGHVLLDLDESGARLLAKHAFPVRPSCVISSERFSADLYERATTPLPIDNGGEWRDFGINE